MTKFYDAAYRKATKSVVAAQMLIAAATTLFTAHGDVEVVIFGKISVAVTAAAGALTLEVGIAGNTAALIAQTAKANLLADKMWAGTPAANPQAMPSRFLLASGQSIILTTGTTNADGGAIDFTALWKPISTNGALVAA